MPPQSQETVLNENSQKQARAPTQPEPAAALSAQPSKRQQKHHRTHGLWAFDALLYPLLNNISVFALSVYATYKTQFGGDSWFKRRGNVVRSFTQSKFNWSEKTSNNAVMVAFSFIDGSIMAPFIKMLEDRRGPISHWLDRQFGTEPKDVSVYKQEPKQSWSSLLAGRILTLSLVFPAAVKLGKSRNGKPSWNDTLFINPAANLIKKNPGIQRRFPGINMEGLATTLAFEAFYTSLCTAGLYLWSRTIARAIPKVFGHKNKNESRQDVASSLAPITHNTPPSDAHRHEPENTISSETGVPLGPHTAAVMGANDIMPFKPVIGNVTDMLAKQQATTANSQQAMHGAA